MPYATNQSLPKAVRQHLPPRGQSMWRKVFNSASRQYKGQESKAFATAWAAVKKAGYDPPPEYDMPAAGAHVLEDLLAQDAVTINGWTLESLRELLDHHPDEFPLIWESSERDDFAYVHVAGDEGHPVELREIGGDVAVTFSRRPHTRIVTPSWRAAVGLAAEALHHGPRIVAPAAADVLVLSYVPEEGVLLRGPTKENKDAIKKTNLFRYSRNLPRGASWYVQRSRGRALSREHLESYASALRRGGASVEVEFEGSATPVSAAIPSPRSASPHSIASARLRELADSMEAKADQEIGAQRLENTPRRAAMASGIRGRAEQQKVLAQVMRRAADALDSGANYQHVSKISTRADIEALDSSLRSSGWVRRRVQGLSLNIDEQPEPVLEDVDFAEFGGVVSDRRQLRDLIEQTERIRGAKDHVQTLRSASARLGESFEPLRAREVDAARSLIALSRRSKLQLSGGAERIEERVRDADRFAKLGIVDTATLRVALREYFGCCRGKVSVGREDPMRKRLRDIQFAKIPGYFPTPPELAARVADLADVRPGMRVLEPSAGSGSLALAVLEREPEAEVDVIERNLTLRAVLEDRGLRLVASDFAEFEATEPYDRIVMNPPFEERQDTKHISRALDMLAPGGRLVAIASGSFPTRSDAATVDLREQLERMGATIEPLPAGTFKGSGTDVSTVLIVADKPGSAPAFPRQARPSLLSADEPEPPSDPIVSADNFEVRKIVGYRVRLRDGVYGDVEGWGIWDRSTGGWVGSERTFAIGPKATASAVVPMSFDLKRTAELAIKDGLIAGYPVVGYSDPTGWSRTASVKIEPDQPARPVGLPPGAVSIFDLDKLEPLSQSLTREPDKGWTVAANTGPQRDWWDDDTLLAMLPNGGKGYYIERAYDVPKSAQLVIGYRDNRDRARHREALDDAASALRARGVKIRMRDDTIAVYAPSKSEPATQEAPAMVERTQPGSLFSTEDEGFALVGQRGAPVGRFVPPQGEQIGLEGVSRKPSSEKMEEIAREERARGPVEESTGPMFASSMTPERLAALPVDLSRYRRPSSTVGGIFGGFGDRALHDFLASILAKDHPAGHARARARGMWDANELDKHAAYLAIAEALEAEQPGSPRAPSYSEPIPATEIAREERAHGPRGPVESTGDESYERAVMSVAWNAWLDEPGHGSLFSGPSEIAAVQSLVAKKRMRIDRIDKPGEQIQASLTPGEAKRREAAETDPYNLVHISWNKARPVYKSMSGVRYPPARLRVAEKVLILDEAKVDDVKKAIAWADEHGFTIAIDPGPVWVWSGKDRDGRPVGGELDASKKGAPTEAAARDQLAKQGAKGSVDLKKRATPTVKQLEELGFIRNPERFLEVKQRYIHRPAPKKEESALKEGERAPAYPELAARQARPSLPVPSDQVVLTYTPVAGILLSGPTKSHKEKIKAARAGKLSFRWSPKTKAWYVPRSSAGRSGQPIPRADIEALARALSDMGVPVRIEINGSAAPVAPAAPAAAVELPPGLPAVPLDPAVQSRLIKSNPRKAEAESLALVPAYSPTDYRWHIVYIYTGGIEPSRSYATKIGGHTIVAKPPSFLGGFWTLNIDGQRWGERGRDKFEEAAHDLTRWVASQSWPVAPPLVSPQTGIAVEVDDGPGGELPTANWRAELLRVYNPKTRADEISVALLKDGHAIYGDDGIALDRALEFGAYDSSLQRIARKLADAMFEAIDRQWPDLSPSVNTATLNARTHIYGTDVARFEAWARKSEREVRKRRQAQARAASPLFVELTTLPPKKANVQWSASDSVPITIEPADQDSSGLWRSAKKLADEIWLVTVGRGRDADRLLVDHHDGRWSARPVDRQGIARSHGPVADSPARVVSLLLPLLRVPLSPEEVAGRLPGHGVGRPETSTRKWPDTAPSEPPPPKLTPREQREQKRTERNAARREREREKKEAAEREREAKRQARRDRDQAKREAESQEKGRAAERRLEREQARAVENAKRRIKPAECACRRAREGVRVASAAYEVARTKLIAAESVPETCSAKPTTSADRRARARRRLDDATAALDKARAAELAAESRLAELRALAGEVAPPSPVGAYGLETLVVVPSARGTPRTIPARYVLVDAERIIPSHDATTFEARPDYPPATQERKYEKSQSEQLKVQDVARNMIPQLVQNTNAGAVDGTPIVDQSMIVLSGNGRAMGVQRHYRTNHHDLHAWLADNAAQFGFTRADVLRAGRPLVVREVSVDPKDRARLVRDFNEGLTQRLDVYDELAAKSRQLPPDVLAILRDGEADKMGLKSFLTSPSASRLIFALEQSGFINRANRTRMLRGADHLSPEAQREVGSLLSSAVVAGDVAPFLRHMMDRSAAAWLVAAAAGEGWDVRRQLGLAVVELGSIRSADQCLVRWRQQSDLSGPRPTDGDPMARALLEILVVTASSPARFEAIARGFAERSREGGGGLFAAPVDPVEALRESAAAAGAILESAESKTRCRKRRK